MKCEHGDRRLWEPAAPFVKNADGTLTRLYLCTACGQHFEADFNNIAAQESQN